MSVGTAFYPRERELNRKQSWGEWSGYLAAQTYAEFHDIEYNAIREAVAAIDVTPLYKYVVSGPGAAELLDRVMTRNIASVQMDQVVYSPWCDEDGKVIDDGTITRIAHDAYRITAADPTYRWFLLNATGLDVQVEDVSEAIAGLALQGPFARAVLEAATGQDWTPVRYYRRRPTSIAGVDVDVTRTGYTGDLGYELWIPAEQALTVWDRVFDVGSDFGIHAAGINALDVSRVEAGLILIEAEYTSARHATAAEQKYSPFEIGLGRLVAFDKGAQFVGKRALLAERAAGGPARRLCGMELEWAGIETMYTKHDLPPSVSPFVHRAPVPAYKEGRQVGRVTSICWGPTIKKMVGFGSLDAKLAEPGQRVSVEWTVEGERGKVAATVVPLPFLDLARKRE